MAFQTLCSKPSKPVTDNPAVITPNMPSVVNRSLPARLQIPKLKIDSPVSYMGLTANGDMMAPTKYSEVGWYKNGPLPGNMGSAVMDGHVNGPRGQPGVFYGLNQLIAGDVISVIDSTGQASDFVVTRSQKYKENAPTQDIFTSKNGAHLNLITCTGAWDKANHQFLERLVVFTDMVP